MTKAPPTPKGFRDILPDLAKRKREVIAKIASVLEDNGFVPLETPVVEFAETLLGKYGEEADRLIYTFKDRGGRNLGLRYDLTVPLARFIASNPSLIANGKTFSRYQVGEVFRGENPQKGRFREFTQFDMDTVGSSDLKEDAKIIAAALTAVKNLKLNAYMEINDRQLFEGVSPELIRIVDKWKKIGRKGVIDEMLKKRLASSAEEAVAILCPIEENLPSDRLNKIFSALKQMGFKAEKDFKFSPTLARGLDYYTGSIFELFAPEYDNLSLGAGGRYDNLIGMFSGKPIPAVGFSLGIDRLLEALDEVA